MRLMIVRSISMFCFFSSLLLTANYAHSGGDFPLWKILLLGVVSTTFVLSFSELIREIIKDALDEQSLNDLLGELDRKVDSNN